jgi:hypothetical protein
MTSFYFTWRLACDFYNGDSNRTLNYKGLANGGGNVCFNPALCYKILGMNGSATKSATKNTLEENDRRPRIERRTI